MPAATASGSAIPPGLGVRTPVPAAQGWGLAIGTVTDPPLLVIALRVSAPVAGATGIGIAPLILTTAAPVILTMPTALATGLAVPPTQVGTGNATLVQPPAATASGLAVIPALSIRASIPAAIATGLAPAPAIGVMIHPLAAFALGSAFAPIIVLVGTPSGIITGRMVIIDRIRGTVDII